MDRATSGIDVGLTFPDEEPRRAPKQRPTIQSSSAIPAASKVFEAPTTGALPEIISANWGDIVNAGISLRMYGDLIRMAAVPSGWRGPGSLALRPISLRNFIAFWSAIRDVAKEPELTLAPDGSLHAEWFKSPRQRLDVRFSDQNVFFGLLNHNSILEGAEHPNTVAEILKLHHAKPLTWRAQ